MANQHASSVGSAPASLVGNAFVNRYYKTLHQTPHLGYRFYTEDSRITRAEPLPETTVEPTTSLSGINEKITSWDYHAMRTEIITVDSQESLAGRVLVMVTGALYSGGGLRRMFVQTFVLVPQEKRYYIYNDIFRFLDEGSKSHHKLASQVATNKPNLRDPMPSTALNEGIKEVNSPPQSWERSDSAVKPEAFTSQYSSLREQEEDSAAEKRSEPTVENHVPDTVNVNLTENSVVESVGQSLVEAAALKSNEHPDTLVESNAEAPKKSYASILRVQKDSAKVTNSIVPMPNGSKVTSNISERSSSLGASQAVSSAPSQALSGATLRSQDSMEEMATIEGEGDGRSVYVKSLPLNVTSAELEQEFSKFGLLKNGGINLRNQRIGVCYAFIEFQEASSAQRATEASPINMNGRQVYIEEKRILPARGIRGRPYQGRGYQNDGLRARGYYGIGRGNSRVQMDSERDFGQGRGRGMMASSRGGSGGGNFNLSNTFRRPEFQNGSTFRPIRRAGNQMGRNGPLARNGIIMAAA